MMEFTRDHAKMIIEMHDIDMTLENEEELECLEMGNPEILEAYRALMEFADGY